MEGHARSSLVAAAVGGATVAAALAGAGDRGLDRVVASAHAQATSSVRGTVRAAPSRPGLAARPDQGLADVRIAFTRTAGAGAVPAPVTTGASGGFTAAGFDPDGRYEARARFGASGRVGTRTRGSGMAKVRVVLARVGGGSAPAAVETDAHGDWRPEGFDADAVYRATPARGLFTFDPPTLELRGAAGEVVRDAAVDVPDTFALAGRSRRPDGRALAGAVLQAKVPLRAGELPCATAGADRAFRLEGLRTGEARVDNHCPRPDERPRRMR
jgi:hypothetical protein